MKKEDLNRYADILKKRITRVNEHGAEYNNEYLVAIAKAIKVLLEVDKKIESLESTKE